MGLITILGIALFRHLLATFQGGMFFCRTDCLFWPWGPYSASKDWGGIGVLRYRPFLSKMKRIAVRSFLNGMLKTIYESETTWKVLSNGTASIFLAFFVWEPSAKTVGLLDHDNEILYHIAFFLGGGGWRPQLPHSQIDPASDGWSHTPILCNILQNKKFPSDLS